MTIDRRHDLRHDDPVGRQLDTESLVPRSIFGRPARFRDFQRNKRFFYAFMLIIIASAGAGPYSLDALILGLINKHAA